MWKLLQVLTVLVITTQNDAEIRQFGKVHRDLLLKLHNQARAATGADDMPLLTWNFAMATFAEKHSENMTMDNCSLANFEHSNDTNRNGSPGCVGHGCGENIARFMQSPRITDPEEINNKEIEWLTANFNGWDEEKHMYNISTNTCACSNCDKECGEDQACKDTKQKCQERCSRTGPVCGHYTQNVWWETNKLGCGAALANCAGKFQGYFLTCLYRKQGNDGGRPYDRNLYTTTLSANAAQNLIAECVNQRNPNDGPKYNPTDGSYEQETTYECDTDGWCLKTIKEKFPNGSWRSRSSASQRCR